MAKADTRDTFISHAKEFPCSVPLRRHTRGDSSDLIPNSLKKKMNAAIQGNEVCIREQLQDLLNFSTATLKTFASTRQQQITSSLSFQEWTTFSESLEPTGEGPVTNFQAMRNFLIPLIF
jgi:hypothetical protein